MKNRRSWMLPVGLSLVTWTTLSLATPAPLQSGNPIGANYCGPAMPNSTGLPAVISAFGSQLVSDNDVTLFASPVPPGQFGYFLNSQVGCGWLGCPPVPFHICLSGPIGRHFLPGQVQTGPTISITLDLNAIPTPTGFVAVQPGATWHFQCWYRDLGNTNNFTDAVSVTFL